LFQKEKARSIARILVNHRKVRGMTQREFARQIGVDPSALTRGNAKNASRADRFTKIVFGTLL
jgi:transcriptional regulator with XRE-family HTH domain